MSKDPAFLFYSNDFYSGTRLMTPEERACYIDLLIYQHQNGIIPLNLDRVLMFCTGISKDTLDFVLSEKFTKTKKGYLNEKLDEIIDKRSSFTRKKSILAVLGNYIKSHKELTQNQIENAKKQFNPYDFINIKDDIERKELIYSKLNNITQTTLSDTLSERIKENENENEIINKDISYLLKENKEIINLIMQYFNFNSMNNPDKQTKIFRFLKRIIEINKLDYFKQQFADYKTYKKKSNEKRHGFDSFLGLDKENILEGGWNSENWGAKLKDLTNGDDDPLNNYGRPFDHASYCIRGNPDTVTPKYQNWQNGARKVYERILKEGRITTEVTFH